MQLTEKNLFKMLASLVSSQDSSPPLKTTSVFLITYILLDNSDSVSTTTHTLESCYCPSVQGQHLARETRLLAKIIDQFK